jgi:Na+-translocating ferredoxin:NAD+ oxidoreductase RnfG subunit
MVLTISSLRLGVLIMILCLASSTRIMAQDRHALSKKEMKELSRIFEGEVLVSEVILADLSIPREELLRTGDLLFKIAGGNETRGYVLSTQAKGRFDYFDYSVFYSKDLVVMGIKVTVYRSTHGAAICQKKWLSQFNGYEGEELKLGKEIDAISGATFSAESITEDIQRCFALMTGLKDEGIIQ